MTEDIDLGKLCLSCPSAKFDLSLTSSIRVSTLMTRHSVDLLSVADIESGRAWLSPGIHVHLRICLSLPPSISPLDPLALTRILLTALRHSALWKRLHLQASTSAEPSPSSELCLRLDVLLKSAALCVSDKPPIHRLAKDVPYQHLKPPDGVIHLVLEQISFNIDLTSSLRSFSQSKNARSDSPTLFDQEGTLPSGADLETLVAVIDTALRLAINDLSSKALSKFKITEKSSFRHLQQVCPAMWSPGYLEAMASRAIFLPTISHAIAHSMRQRCSSSQLKVKLDEIARQERLSHVNIEDEESDHQQRQVKSVQQAVTIRLWRLMQHRLRDSFVVKNIDPILTTNLESLPVDEDADIDDVFNLTDDAEEQTIMQPDTPDEFIDSDYESDWGNLFAYTDEDDDCLFEDELPGLALDTSLSPAFSSDTLFSELFTLSEHDPMQLDEFERLFGCDDTTLDI